MKGPATELIHAGETERGVAVPLTTPIYETTTFIFDNAQEVVAYNEGRSNKYLYSRYTNPTVVSVEQKLAVIDRAETALTFSSGMGATATILMAHLKAGDEVVCGAAIYGGTLHLLHDMLARFGVTPRFVSLDDLANLERVFTDRTRLVWFESPINPTLRCVDMRRWRTRAARAA
jgi:Cystathionine beta-lyases/cystathionine gamma-synthases